MSNCSDSETLAIEVRNVKKRKCNIEVLWKCPNLTPVEKSLLRELVKDKIDLVECTANDYGVAAKKAAAWTAISVDFCKAEHTYNRSAEQLKKAWRNMKRPTAKNKNSSTGHTAKVLPKILPWNQKNIVIAGPVPGIVMKPIAPSQVDSVNCDANAVAPSSNASDDYVDLPVIAIYNDSDQSKENEQEPKTNTETEKRKSENAQSSLGDGEAEERRIRLETLKLQQRIEERRLEIMEEQHKIQMQILNKQLNLATPSVEASFGVFYKMKP